MKYEQIEKDFVASTYPSPEWSISDIADTLEIEPRRVKAIARRIAVKRPDTRLTAEQKAFVDETYISKEWTVAQIAKRLGTTEGVVRAYAGYKKLRRPLGCGNRPKHNWRKIWELSKGRSLGNAAIDMDISREAVVYAMNRMWAMTPDERESLWQEWGFK